MSAAVLILLWIVILFHVLAFVGEAFLWMQPALHRGLIAKVNPGSPLDPLTEATAMKKLMINQGVYNLMIALGGLVAVFLGGAEGGLVLAMFIFAFAAAAGVTLAATSTAYAGAALQALPGILGIVLMLS
ncbi:DUF1304 family protein [Pseudooceanicola sp. C21-150M6]|uniref:DUF1304 family protein n=1 Tax=Pseudooceanicola sp. C21-150M6 TaxID=3434355 RepID=UPI003D7F47DA